MRLGSPPGNSLHAPTDRGRQSRRFRSILLDDTPISQYQELSPYHGETSLQPLYARAGGDPAKISDREWNPAVARTLRRFGIHDVVPVHYVVGAMTRAQATDLRDHPKQWAHDPEAYRAVSRLRQKTSPFDPNQYGDTPDDWKPFPHEPTLATVGIGDLIGGMTPLSDRPKESRTTANG